MALTKHEQLAAQIHKFVVDAVSMEPNHRPSGVPGPCCRSSKSARRKKIARKAVAVSVAAATGAKAPPAGKRQKLAEKAVGVKLTDAEKAVGVKLTDGDVFWPIETGKKNTCRLLPRARGGCSGETQRVLIFQRGPCYSPPLVSIPVRGL